MTVTCWLDCAPLQVRVFRAGVGLIDSEQQQQQQQQPKLGPGWRGVPQVPVCAGAVVLALQSVVLGLGVCGPGGPGDPAVVAWLHAPSSTTLLA